MVNQKTVDLGFIIKRFKDYDFSMDTKCDRGKLQHFIYLLQAHDVYLGYDYSWYMDGPYSIMLAKHGFELESVYDEIPNDEVEFSNDDTQDNFIKFAEFVKNADAEYLKTAASLHMLKACGMSDEEVITKVIDDSIDAKHELSKDYCTKILNDTNMLDNAKLGKITPFSNEINIGKIIPHDDVANTIAMKDKVTDKAIYYLMRDMSNRDMRLVGENIFRPHERHPEPDELITDDATSIRLMMSDF